MISAPDYRHYTPILRWKKAEKDALSKLFHFRTDTSRLTPLIEPMPSDFEIVSSPTIRAAAYKLADEVLNYWGDEQLIYLDLANVPADLCLRDGTHALTLLDDASNSRFGFVPVTGLHRDTTYQKAVYSMLQRHSPLEDYDLGLCLRLSPNDVLAPKGHQEIKSFLSNLELEARNVDLLIDFKFLTSNGYSYASIYECVPKLDEWHNLIFAGGAWPKDLTGYPPTATYELARSEWLQWHTLVTQTQRRERLPAFADYTIRHPEFEADLSDGPFNTSASIRYTASDKYLIMRGEWVNKPGGPGYDQYLGHAAMLAERPEYSGADFSYGDQYIMERSKDLTKPDPKDRHTGNATTWIEAGINHHITLVLHQLANLPAA